MYDRKWKGTGISEQKEKGQKKNGKECSGGLCSSLGTLLLVLLIAACVPLTVPRMLGYALYTVVSGSMEPAIPTGSLVYVEHVAPEDIEEGDVIAFYDAVDVASVITPSSGDKQYRHGGICHQRGCQRGQ